MFEASSSLGRIFALTCLKYPSEQRVGRGGGGLEEYIGVPAPQSLPCFCRSYMGGEGMGAWSIGCCAT